MWRPDGDEHPKPQLVVDFGIPQFHLFKSRQSVLVLAKSGDTHSKGARIISNDNFQAPLRSLRHLTCHRLVIKVDYLRQHGVSISSRCIAQVINGVERQGSCNMLCNTSDRSGTSDSGSWLTLPMHVTQPGPGTRLPMSVSS